MVEKELLEESKDRNASEAEDTQLRTVLADDVWSRPERPFAISSGTSTDRTDDAKSGRGASAGNSHRSNLPEINLKGNGVKVKPDAVGASASKRSGAEIAKELVEESIPFLTRQTVKGVNLILDGFELAATAADKAMKKGLQQLPNPYDKFDHKGDDSDIGKNDKTPTVEEKLEWRGSNISLKTRDGMPVSFKDAEGKEWQSEDGKGWRLDGDGVVTREARIYFDKDPKQIREENPYGVTTRFKEDGTLTQSFKSAEGKEISLTKQADGTQTLVDGNKTWQSKDGGKTWTSGTEQKTAEIQIDEFGRLRTKDSNGKDLIESQSKELQAISTRMLDMQKKFNIKFGRPPEQVEHDDDEGANKRKLDLRFPTQEELTLVEDALKKYSHVARKNGSDFGGLKFSWVTSDGHGAEVTDHGWHNGGKNPNINFGPKDTAKTRGWDGFEGTLLHELAHQLQEIRWKDREGNETVPRNLERFFGYEKVMPPLTKEEDGTYRIIDRDGKKYQFEKITEDGKEVERWLPLNKDGKPSPNLLTALTEKQMRERMADNKKPATDYFFHPQEAHAEAMAMLFFSPKALYDVNPSLYNATKQWDQADINFRHGFTKAPDGKQIPKMIRGVDGNVLPNTAENRKAVSEREEQWRNTPKEEKHAALPLVGRRCSCHA